MKTIIFLLAISLMCFTAPQEPTYVIHQPDFTQAQFYSWDSIYTVEEDNTGTAHTQIKGEEFYDVCDFMECTDSITTYWTINGIRGDVTSYSKRTPGYWTMYVNGVANGKARVEGNTLVTEEVLEAVDEKGGYYLLKIEYYESKIIDDIKHKISHTDRRFPEN